MSEPLKNDDTGTHQVSEVFGPRWRWWVTFKRQFTPTSLSFIVTLVMGGGGYIAHLRESVVQVRERVVVLETKIIPYVSGQTDIASLQAQITGHEGRIHRLEQNWDDAGKEAATDPRPRRHK